MKLKLREEKMRLGAIILISLVGILVLMAAEEAPRLDLSQTTSGRITMDFRDADIKTVLRLISTKSGVNIVAGDEVKGLVTIRLVDVPWEKALKVILRTYGFTYEREGNIIRVTTLERLQQEELVTEVFSLNYGKASEVMESVREMLSERGRIKYDERTNLLIVSDIPINLYKVGEVVKRLDRPTPQVMIEAKVIETTLDKDEKLGINWISQVTLSLAKRPHLFPFKKHSDRRVLQGDFPDVDSATTDNTQFTYGTLDFTQFQAVLELLNSRQDTKIISNPRIITLNNQEASIVVGEIVSIPVYERNETTGSIEITGYTERDVGIKLKVTPHVNEQGDIVVELHPEVSSLIGFDEFGNLKAPRFSTREATTQVMVKDGQTIVIGGLIKENIVDYKKKFPFLGDIPLIGFLFTKKEKTKDKTDLLFFITTHLLKDEEGSK